MTPRYPVVTDAARLALGTLTAFPVRPPRVVDRRTSAWAMVLAPAVGLLLALAAGAWLWLLGWGPTRQPLLHPVLGDRAYDLVAGPMLSAALTVGLLAWLTRALHLDGLADTVDGLGSRRPRDQALEIMRRGDVGPFGVVSLVLVLAVQVVALAELLAAGLGVAALTLALVVSRLVLPVLCSRGVPAARPDGLGRTVAGSVGRPQLVAAFALAAALLVPVVLVSPGPHALTPGVVARAVGVAGVALAAGVLVARRAVGRLGGVTGDVLGAAVEVTFTVSLVVLTLVV